MLTQNIFHIIFFFDDIMNFYNSIIKIIELGKKCIIDMNNTKEIKLSDVEQIIIRNQYENIDISFSSEIILHGELYDIEKINYIFYEILRCKFDKYFNDIIDHIYLQNTKYKFDKSFVEIFDMPKNVPRFAFSKPFYDFLIKVYYKQQILLSVYHETNYDFLITDLDKNLSKKMDNIGIINDKMNKRKKIISINHLYKSLMSHFNEFLKKELWKIPCDMKMNLIYQYYHEQYPKEDMDIKYVFDNFFRELNKLYYCKLFDFVHEKLKSHKLNYFNDKKRKIRNDISFKFN